MLGLAKIDRTKYLSLIQFDSLREAEDMRGVIYSTNRFFDAIGRRHHLSLDRVGISKRNPELNLPVSLIDFPRRSTHLETDRA